MSSPDVLVVDSKFPEPDRDAGSLRMYNLLLVLKELSPVLRFASRSGFQPNDYSRVLEKAGIGLATEPAGEYIHRTRDNCDIAILSRPGNASEMIEPIQEKYPNARIIFDTVDLHHLRLYREARLTGNAPALQRALAYKAREVSLTRETDCTLVVSAYEREVLAELCPEADIRVVSLIHDVIPKGKGFLDRRNIFFVGSFYHRPNIDAVLFYASEIRPKVRENLPGIKCHIIGEDPPPEILALASDDLIVEGYVEKLEPFFDHCRLSIAPLRYGAGVKGKVLLSMSRGVPVVATPTAAEGIPGKTDAGMLVADSGLEFSSAVQRVYSDPVLWEKLSAGGNKTIRDCFSPEVASSKLAELFRDFGF
jgi:glycosyltransferase involved in cell wall biosynthesis